MNRDDIVSMVWESGAKDKMGALQISRIELEAFAIFIEEAEREACALIAENQWETPGTQRRTAERCASAIRAMGK